MSDLNLKQKIDSLVDSKKEDIVQSLQQILRFRTVSGAPDEQGQKVYEQDIARCLRYLESLSDKFGFQWKNHNNVYAYAHLEGGNSFVGLPLHIDVVPAGEGWVHGPFSGDMENGVIYGRGCQDDKGPLVQMLYATAILKELGIPLKRGARLIIGTTEEFGEWYDIKQYFENEEAPELSIVSDAAFPIINGEKGIINLILDANFETDSEPNVGGLRFKSASAGERANIVPPRATLEFEGDAETDLTALKNELDRYIVSHIGTKVEIHENSNGVRLVFHGKGAHGSTPEEGKNAALSMLEFITQSGFVSDDEADMAEFLLNTGSGLNGENLNIDVRHDVMGPTTVNLGVLRWEGGNVNATYNIRNTMGLSVDDAIARAQAVCNDFAEETGFEVSATPRGKALNPIYLDPAQHPEFLDALKEAYTTVTGREAKLQTIGGTTYSKVFPNAVCFGPVDLEDGEHELAHQAEERVSVEHLLRNVKIYAYALAKVCGA